MLADLVSKIMEQEPKGLQESAPLDSSQLPIFDVLK